MGSSHGGSPDVSSSSSWRIPAQMEYVFGVYPRVSYQLESVQREAVRISWSWMLRAPSWCLSSSPSSLIKPSHRKAKQIFRSRRFHKKSVQSFGIRILKIFNLCACRFAEETPSAACICNSFGRSSKLVPTGEGWSIKLVNHHHGLTRCRRGN